MPTRPTIFSAVQARRPPSRRGLTLVEVMFSIVVLSTMVLAALGAAGASARGRVGQQESAIGLSFGRQLLSEIMQTRYMDLQTPIAGIEIGESRATFDDVDDYNGLNEASAQTSTGVVLSGGAGWRRAVTVQWVTTANPTLVSATETGLKKITVTVTSPTGRQTVVTGLRSQNDSYEHTPGSQTTYTAHAGVRIQVGNSGATANVQGVALTNLIP